nr:hypothetical protein [Mycoplasmopsis bovis]
MNQKSGHLNCEFNCNRDDSIILIFIITNKTNKPNEVIHTVNEFLWRIEKLDPKKYYLEIDVLMLNNLT